MRNQDRLVLRDWSSFIVRVGVPSGIIVMFVVLTGLHSGGASGSPSQGLYWLLFAALVIYAVPSFLATLHGYVLDLDEGTLTWPSALAYVPLLNVAPKVIRLRDIERVSEKSSVRREYRAIRDNRNRWVGNRQVNHQTITIRIETRDQLHTITIASSEAAENFSYRLAREVRASCAGR